MELGSDVRELLSLFEKFRVKYLLVGGHAVAVYGLMRYTEDIDFYVGRSLENSFALRQALKEFFSTDAGLPTIEEFTQDRQLITFGRAPNCIDILNTLSGIEFEDAYQARVKTELEGVPISVISKEFLLRNKRATNRAKDRLDAETLEKLKP